jgi:hypothetical protein
MQTLDSFIKSLDPDKDALLICLINQKIEAVEYKLSHKYKVTDNELYNAEKGMMLTISREKYRQAKEHPIHSKIQSILDRHKCEDCKFKKLYKNNSYGFYTMDDNNPICISCNDKLGNMRYIQQEIEDRYVDAEIKIDLEPLIELKAIVNKINRKLNKIKQKQKFKSHDAS